MKKIWTSCLGLLVFLAIAKVLIAQPSMDGVVSTQPIESNVITDVINETDSMMDKGMAMNEGTMMNEGMPMNEDMGMHEENGN